MACSCSGRGRTGVCYLILPRVNCKVTLGAYQVEVYTSPPFHDGVKSTDKISNVGKRGALSLVSTDCTTINYWRLTF